MILRGFVDFVTAERITGWVADAENLGLTFLVEVELDGRVIAQVTANEMRGDLRRAGIGSGAYGFSADFNNAVSVAEVERILVNALGADGERTPIPRYEAPAPFNPQKMDGAAFPVFILGAARSGTSVVAHALLLNTRYVGPHEGHVLDLLAPLGALIEKFYALKSDVIQDRNMVTMLREVPRSYFDDALSTLFLEVAATFFPTPYWLDKTPTAEMIRAAPRLAAIWPQARFIFMRRRGFENVLSQRRKFKKETFQTHCNWWADCMATWLKSRRQLAGRAIEIDQYLLAHDPALAAGLITELLSLEPREHRDMADFLMTEHTEQTGLSVDRVESGMPEAWDAEQRRIFTETCLPLFAPFGYAEDSRYFLSADEDAAWARI